MNKDECPSQPLRAAAVSLGIRKPNGSSSPLKRAIAEEARGRLNGASPGPSGQSSRQRSGSVKLELKESRR